MTSKLRPPRSHGQPVTAPTDRGDDRAVSDLVGYVLMVAVILVGVGLTATVGVDRLEQAQLSQNTQGVERGMQLLEGNIDEIQSSRAESRTTTLSLSSGRVTINATDAPSSVLVNVSGTGDSPTRYRMGAITYRFDDGVVAYEGGGVFLRTFRGNPITSAEPTFICDDDRAIVSIVTLQGPAVNNSYGGAEADVVTRRNASRVLFPINRTGADSLDESTGVNVTVDSAHASAWRRYLLGGDQEWVEQSGPPNLQFRCEPTTGLVYVRQTVVNVSVRR